MQRIVMNFFITPNAEQNSSLPHLPQYGLRPDRQLPQNVMLRIEIYHRSSLSNFQYGRPDQLLGQYLGRVIETGSFGVPFFVDRYADGVRASVAIGSNLPSSNMAIEIHVEHPSHVYMPPVWQQFPTNPLRVAVGESRILMTRESANNPDMHLEIELPNDLPRNYMSIYMTNEMQYRHVLDLRAGIGTYYSSGVLFRSPNQTLFSYSFQQIARPGNIPPPTGHQFGNLFNPTDYINGNHPQPQPRSSSLYNPPNQTDHPDPHIRAFYAHYGGYSSSDSN